MRLPGRAFEPRAIPAESRLTRARESDTREAMCLMIESAARAHEPAARILRPRDLAGEPLPLRRDRAGDAQRPARAGDCAVHAGHRERARPARSLQSGAGAAEIGGVPGRAARPVRQSRTGGRRLQCRPAPGAGVARRHRRRCRRRRAATFSPSRAPRVEDWAKARKGGRTPERMPTSSCRELMALLKQAPSPLRRRARTAHHARRRQIVGRAARRRLQPRQGARDVCRAP